MTTPAPSHIPVLLDPIRDAARGARRVVDATLGHGGHAEMFLALGAEVLGIDRDPDALAIARARLGPGLQTLEAPYASEGGLAAVQAFAPDFVLLDLGVSSKQLDDDTRGFTFRPGAALDMRMGREGPSGADLLNEAEEETLADIFHYWGDERKARPLARAIVRRRANAPFVVSDDFVNAIRSVLGPRSGPGDFARLFQSLRIAVNDELEGLERALPAFLEALRPGGILAVIGYHSGEDRVAKQLFQEWARSCVCPPEQPMCTCRGKPLGSLVPRKPIVPDAAEVAANPRARSAKLRIFRKAE
jgi:16S rRNA (cytosine1402-N4)-methyltransferase